jgi:hypothetical protein
MKLSIMSVMLMFTIIFDQCSSSSCNVSYESGLSVTVKTRYIGSLSVDSSGFVDGVWRQSLSSVQSGTITEFFGRAALGRLHITDAKVPATWTIGVNYLDPACLARVGYQTADFFTGYNLIMSCQALNPFLTFSEKRIFTTQPPSYLILTGKNFSDENSMPKVSIYNDIGILMTSLTAKKLTSSTDGNSDLVIQMPPLTNFWDGDYTFVVQNVGQNGSLTIVGVGVLYIIGNGPQPEPPDPCMNHHQNC